MAHSSHDVGSQPANASGGGADVAVTAVLLTFAGLLDYWVGYEASVLVVYLAPLWFATARMGYRAGLVTIVPATLVWCIADLGHPYSREWILYLNGLTRAVFFACAVIAVHHLVNARAQPHAGVARGTEAPRVDVCGRCEKIRDRSGDWYTVVEFLRERSGLAVHAKVCPDCARKAFVRVGSLAGGPQPGADDHTDASHET